MTRKPDSTTFRKDKPQPDTAQHQDLGADMDSKRLKILRRHNWDFLAVQSNDPDKTNPLPQVRYIAKRSALQTKGDLKPFLEFVFADCEHPVSQDVFEKRLDQCRMAYTQEDIKSDSVTRILQPAEIAGLRKLGKDMGIFEYQTTDFRAFLDNLIEENEERKNASQTDSPVSASKGHDGRAGCVVIPRLSDSTSNSEKKQFEQTYGDILYKSLPYHSCADIQAARDEILSQYPFATEIVDRILAKPARLSVTGKCVIKPTLLVGRPGSGKSSFARAVFKALAFTAYTVNMAGLQDDHFFGVSKGWATAMPSLVLQTVNDSKICNPAFIVDEIDKAPYRKRNGSVIERFLPLLEPTESVNWTESYLQAQMDVSQINWLFTANDLDLLPDFLVSRLDVVQMPTAQAEHIPGIVRRILDGLIAEDELDPLWTPRFTMAEMESLQENWNQHRNLRILKKQVEFIYNEHSQNILSKNN